MSSSPIDRAQQRLPIFPAAPGPGTAGTTALADSHRRWFKRALPRSLWGRSLLIIVLPMVLLEVLATWFFYDRVWDTVVRRLSSAVAGDIGFTLNSLSTADDRAERDLLLAKSGDVTELVYAFREGEKLPAGLQRTTGGSTEEQLAQAMVERVNRPFEIDGDFDPRDLLVSVEMPNGVMQIAVPKKRLSTPTSSLFVLWMMGSSLVLLTIASVFMRNQVRSLQRLAAAADMLGKGRDVPNFKPEGATEVRQAARAFIKMRDRLQRQITQRTEMLAGVSHDLRTPLTRMKLALELMPSDPSVAELKSDVAAMQRMVQGYLDFARGEGEEPERDTDIVLMIRELISSVQRDGPPIFAALPEHHVLPMRPDATRRCIGNIVNNARRYGKHIWITGIAVRDGFDVTVDDDGPGIAAEQRDSVFRPFYRLDAARNPNTGGLGLGLTIARDLARGQGGEVTLEDSPQGGLRVRLHLPS
ncbi:MAG TPA: ATP-binding protein [Stellaceae bacterium]|jgi:two-component system, OmpR family, osmolarity sensor histidine kinase EnvZ|nr:ATP-binding protein [Stellaceae bacterium]